MDRRSEVTRCARRCGDAMNFADRLAQLKGSRLTSVRALEYESPPREEIYAVGTKITISDGTVLDAQFWRLLKEAHPRISIFDHRQQYSLPNPIDAVSVLRDEVTDKKIVGDAYDPMNDTWMPFSVDLANGEVVGGSYPPELPT